MRFLVDAQLPPALARWLAAEGHEAEHVSDCGLSGAADPAIWDHAASVDAVIVTKDEDFAQRKTLDREGAESGVDQTAEHAEARAPRVVRDGAAATITGAGAW
jgi:uncharacterized protein with PIN domain